MDGARKRILILYWHHDPLEEMRAAIRHHLRALENSRIKHDLLYYNAVDGVPAWIRHCRVDAVILHTTFLCLRWSHLFYDWKWKLRWVGDLDCIKIALPQDEYDHSEILDEWLYEWGITVIFSNFDASKRKVLYPIMHDKAVFYECLTGYIDDSAAILSQQYFTTDRPYDLVYRATRLPHWFGSHGQLKHHIADVVAQRARAYGLTCDISTRQEDTIVGELWLRFLASGKAVIGCESGSSVLDRRGEVRATMQAIQRKKPMITVQEMNEHLSAGWDDHEFFAISPRHFEAVITKTCQILVEGRYSGVLKPDRHYIPLKRDLSNVEEVLKKVRDDQLVRTIADQAYHDIYLSGRYTYGALASDIESALMGEETCHQGNRSVFNRMMWPIALTNSRLRLQGLRAHSRFERCVKAAKRLYEPLA
jgi:hypothetical protein